MYFSIPFFTRPRAPSTTGIGYGSNGYRLLFCYAFVYTLFSLILSIQRQGGLLSLVVYCRSYTLGWSHLSRFCVDSSWFSDIDLELQ